MLRSKRAVVIIIGAVALGLAGMFGALMTFERGNEASGAGPFLLNDVARTDFTLALGGPLGTRHSRCLGYLSSSGSTAKMDAFCYTVLKPLPAPPPPPPPYQAQDTVGGVVNLTGTINTGTGAVSLSVGCLPGDLNGDTDVTDGIAVSLTGTATKTGTMPTASVLLNIDDGDAGARQGPGFACSEVDASSSGPVTTVSLGPNDDSDGDTCMTRKEVGTLPAGGGKRDPFNPYDYFNANKLGVIDVDDIFYVGAPGRIFTVFGQMGYTPNADREANSLDPGPGGWNLGPQNNVIDLDDIFSVVGSIFHNCLP